MLIFDAIKRTGLNFQSRVAWVVSHGLTPKKRLSERYETALIFSKGEPSVFNPASARTPQKQPNKRSYKGPHKGKLRSDEHTSELQSLMRTSYAVFRLKKKKK